MKISGSFPAPCLRRPIHLQRRRFLQLAAAGSLAGIAGAGPSAAAVPAEQYAAVDASAASPELRRFMTDFFAAKTRRDVGATMEFFSPDLVTYIDAVLGWDLAGHAAVKGVFAEYMPKWPDTARSYPTRIVGDMEGGAFVAFTDTPELFGGELRLLAAIDFRDGKILRWIDHWDSRDWPNNFGLQKTPLSDFRVAALPSAASARMKDVAARLFTGYAAGSVDGDLFSEDVVYEDMALRSQLQGRGNVVAYLGRGLAALPYGTGASLRHVTGSDRGGAIEWSGASRTPIGTGVTGIVLDGEGRIARLTTVYDGGLLDKATIAPLAAAVLNI